MAEDVVGDDVGHPGEVAGLLKFTERGGGAVVAEPFEDELVVGSGTVEGDLHAGELSPSSAVGVGGADDDEGGDDDLEVARLAPACMAPAATSGTTVSAG